jgi:hypothetical protein
MLSTIKALIHIDLLVEKITALYNDESSDSWTYSKESYLLGKNEFTFERDNIGNMTGYSNPSELLQ